MPRTRKGLRLTFADEGAFHSVTVPIELEGLKDYDRLVDLLREDPEVTRRLYVDVKRLVWAAFIEEEEE